LRQFLDNVLHNGFLADGQHFFRLRFSRGQQACTQSGDGYDCVSDSQW
jgi:hypothetical protein